MKTLFGALLISLSLGAAVGAEGDRLDHARMLMFDRDWPKAVEELRRVVADRKEPLRDEASLWLAHTLFQIGRSTEALRVIAALETEYPRSRWLLPAQSLRVEIATKIGQPDVLWRAARVPQVVG
ncbi:MAG: hypothetical protein M3R55_03135, partial [Acidobacteriota bacterium]|nr:hypothetical protein [Acidobacteriota bacterium]